MAQCSELMPSVESVRLCESVEDRRIWLLDSLKIFSCKSMIQYLRVDDSVQNFLLASFLWKAYVTPNVKVFESLLALGK